MEKETEWLDGDVRRKKEEQRWVGCEGVEGVEGGGRVLVKGEINQLKAIGGKRLLQCH